MFILAAMPICAWSDEGKKADRQPIAPALPLQEMLRQGPSRRASTEMLLASVPRPEKYADSRLGIAQHFLQRQSRRDGLPSPSCPRHSRRKWAWPPG